MSRFIEGLRLALETFKAHRLRSFLTTLGIVIGVTAVIAILSLIEGLNRAVTQAIREVGSDVIYLSKYPMVVTGMLDYEELAKRRDFTPEDARAISGLPSVETAVPVITQGFKQIRYRGKEVRNTTIIGSSPGYEKVTNRPVVVGRLISMEDLWRRRGVAVIGSYVAKTLFIQESPIGKDLDLGGHRVQIVGVAKEKGAVLGQSQDNFILVPHTFFDKYFSKPKGMIEQLYFSYSIQALPVPGRTEAAVEEIRELMRRRRGLSYDKPDDFSLDTTGSLLALYRNLTRVGFVAIVAIAAISLVVGGIGIMNIMLASVAERTREIGIRKAVGASNQDILYQFLIESVALSLLGGALGILLGVGLAGLVSLVSPLKAAVTPWVVGLGFGFSACVGIFFGIYPAKRAASLNPIEALRYE